MSVAGRIGCIGFLGVILLVQLAGASTGGADLCAPLGWDRATKEAFFAIRHKGESGLPPTVVRLRLGGPDTVGCDRLPWSTGSGLDSTYNTRLRQLTRKLTPLEEDPWTTMPSLPQIASRESLVAIGDGRYTRYRVSARFGGRDGTIEAITYVDPTVRMVRHYSFRELQMSIGVFSFIGIPSEGGYEVQVPAVIPSKRGTRTVLQWMPE